MSTSSPEAPAWLRKPEQGFLSPAQQTTLDVLFEAILPADHARQIPGGTEAGASAFVSQLLAMPDETYVEIPAWRTLYTDAIQALDDYVLAKYQRPMPGISKAQATEVIAGLEAGALAGLPPGIDQKILFTTLRRHCIQGCFADPRWGGNKDRIMWRAMGYLQPAEDLFHE